MNNQTTKSEIFHILAFTQKEETQTFLFALFFFIYLITILGNVFILAVIYFDSHLHTPMYFFLCNLSLVDIIYTTTILPKLMYILITRDNTISYTQCFTQAFFYVFMATTESMLLVLMAYDRYVAICYPLHYQLIMDMKKCIALATGNWIFECCNASFFIFSISRFSFCYSDVLENFFCDTKDLGKLACSKKKFQLMIYIEMLIFGPLPFFLSLSSYIKIVGVILHIKSTSSRKRAFSTCTSHLTVLFMFYVTGIFTYIRPAPDNPGTTEQMFSVLYTSVIPMLNPMVYTLRNNEVKGALKRLNVLPL